MISSSLRMIPLGRLSRPGQTRITSQNGKTRCADGFTTWSGHQKTLVLSASPHYLQSIQHKALHLLLRSPTASPRTSEAAPYLTASFFFVATAFRISSNNFGVGSKNFSLSVGPLSARQRFVFFKFTYSAFKNMIISRCAMDFLRL